MPIRQDPLPTEEFIPKFQRNVLNSSISAEQYIEWPYIEEHVARAQTFETRENLAAFGTDEETEVDFLTRLEALQGLDRRPFVEELSDVLLDVSPSIDAVDVSLSLLGDTNDTFVVRDYAEDITDIAAALDSGDTEEATEFAEVLTELGLWQLVNRGHDLASVLTGVRLGLESHRRKNRQGDLYMETIGEALATVVADLETAGVSASYDDEVTIDLGDENKTVDYMLYLENEPLIGLELNCYKARGSKPSEIKRAYQKLAERMETHGYQLIWVTDGYAWKKPLENVLREAYESHKDLYNCHMVRAELAEDILAWLETTDTVDSDSTDSSGQSGLGDY
ncbi:DpnII family type II restriction endonuclease [Salinigranum halophilum]|uniref:DpnII family type II restriction endonuclease n=1 Tax=Salinigranum halophilum TaxID=2565931 RepID=UPI0010A8C0E2|nr:DpnII family type II restriction endonuclease [Salinigranum halophilum]